MQIQQTNILKKIEYQGKKTFINILRLITFGWIGLGWAFACIGLGLGLASIELGLELACVGLG